MKLIKFLIPVVCVSFCLSSCSKDEEDVDNSKKEQNPSANVEKKVKTIYSYDVETGELQSRSEYSYNGDNYVETSYLSDSSINRKIVFNVEENKKTTEVYINMNGSLELNNTVVEEYSADNKILKSTMYANGSELSRSEYTYGSDTTKILYVAQGIYEYSITYVVKEGNVEVKTEKMISSGEISSVVKTEYNSDGKIKSVYTYDKNNKVKRSTIYTYNGENYSYVDYSANGEPFCKYEYIVEGDKMTENFYYGENGSLILTAYSVYEYMK